MSAPRKQAGGTENPYGQKEKNVTPVDSNHSSTNNDDESVYSMDSFLADLPPEPEEVMEAAENDARNLLSSYLSPSSATESESVRSQQQTPPPSLLQETIDTVAKQQQSVIEPRHLRNMSSDSLPSIKPVNPFYGAYNDDSDASEGSLVFKPQPQDLPAQQQEPQTKPPASNAHHRRESRDRFPSFDSVGSSGSIRYVPPQRIANPMQRQSSAPANPAMLPYNERRKLMQARQQQQQKKKPEQSQNQQLQQQKPEQAQSQQRRQQQTEHRQPATQYAQPPPPRTGVPYMPGQQAEMAFFHPQLHAQTHPQHIMFPPYSPGMPMHPMPPPNFPMHGQPQNMGPVYPPYPYPLQVPPPVYPYPFHPPPSSPAPQHAVQDPSTRPAENSQRPPKSISSPRSSQSKSNSRPPMPQSFREYASSAGSSFDSSDGAEPSRQSSRKDVPPPPPPPPPSRPAAPPGHVRQESNGSVSSLGSVERPGREEGISLPAKRQGSRGKDFFAKMNPWSPSEPNPKTVSVEDYRRRNQAFLSTVERVSNNNNSNNKLGLVSNVPPQHQRMGSLDRPPVSWGGHRRLPSIDNDDWEEEEGQQVRPGEEVPPRRQSKRRGRGLDVEESSSNVSSSDITDDEADDFAEPDERTSLLPPPAGISSNEYHDAARHDLGYYQSGQQPLLGVSSQQADSERSDMRKTVRHSNATYRQEESKRESKRRKRKSKKGRRSRRRNDGESSGSSASSPKDYNAVLSKKHARALKKERARLMKEWRAEARAIEEKERREKEEKQWHRRLQRSIAASFSAYYERAFKFFAWTESFVGNLPLTIGAIALAIATLGVDWFKFAEEMMESCEPVHFHSAQCTFPEFPGCFYCDTNAKMYKLALNFHWGCYSFAAILAFALVAKLIVARRVVIDDLRSPTTASPAGLICITMDIVFAGRGFLGMVVVSLSSFIHLCLVIWFIYMALAYHIMPDPSWFPNTVGIGISAVKIWLYYPMAGHFLMAISLSLNFFFFPISLIRVALNRKISATVGWMQMSAPNISLYALTIMAQPSFEEEHPDINTFQKVHRRVYLPFMHVLFGLCMLGMVASVSSLAMRWKEFRKLPFSPAYAAFCVPTLSHANAIQAYRAAINSFSDLPPDSFFRVFVFGYWVIFLVGGTIITVVVSGKFLYSLPEWTHIDVEGEIEPPQPYETAMTLSNMILTGESLVQNYVSPAVLQANETGALVVTRDRQGHQRYVRTRKVTALGFEPMMNVIEMEQERELLLEWVGKHPPRRRHRTLSVPGIDFNYASMGTGNAGVYGMEEGQGGTPPASRGRQRSYTASSAPIQRRQSHG